MKYQDNPHLTEKEYSLLKANYEKTQAQESEDLIDLLHKMQEQLDTIVANNADGKYDEIISKLRDSISDLEKLINTNHSQFLHQIKKFGVRPNTFSKSKSPSLQSSLHSHNTHQYSQIPSPWNAYLSGNLHKLDDENTPNENLPDSEKMPENNGQNSINENSEQNSENNVDNTPNNNDNTLNNEDNNVENNNNSFEKEENNTTNNNENDISNNERNVEKPTKTPKRNSPMPSNPIFNAFKSLNVNLNNNLNKLFGKNNSPTKAISRPTAKSSAKTTAYPTTESSINTSIDMQNHGRTQLINSTKKEISSHISNSPQNPNLHTAHMPPQYPPYECYPNTPPNKYPPKPFPPKDREEIKDECNVSDICKNKQIDIVRLFLLYMMLTPTCRYLPTLTTIANTQFEILMQLM